MADCTRTDGLVVAPDVNTFRTLARTHTVIPVFSELLGDLETPVSAFRKLRTDRSFLLESVVHGERWGRFSFLGRDPLFVLTSRDGVVDVEAGGSRSRPGSGCAACVTDSPDPLVAVERILDAYRSPQLAGLPPLHSGLVGYWGYECVRYMERVPVTNPDTLGVPELMLYAAGTIVAFDHFRQRLVVVRNVWVGDTDDDRELVRRYGNAVDAIREVAADLAAPTTSRPHTPEIPDDPGAVESTMTAEAYMAMVRRAKEYILAGDIFQVVCSQRFWRPFDGDPFDVHRALRIVNPSPYMTYLEHPEVTIVCASPEELVRLSGDVALTRPIAGTRWRGANEAEDESLAEELLADPKERAEHVMLVDLARNDLGRFGEFSTVRVPELMTVERYSHVMHIVSTVTARPRHGTGPVDVLRATFPAGTVSGAPKVRAMEIIDELEKVQRGPYAGVVGYMDFSGNLDTALTLRTAVIRDGVAYVQAGGGIVADSDPAYENRESHNKARGVLIALEAAQRLAHNEGRQTSPR